MNSRYLNVFRTSLLVDDVSPYCRFRTVFEQVDRSDTDAISGIHHETSAAQEFAERNTLIRRRAAFLPPEASSSLRFLI